jgi:phosphomethylpyrimidine synthase
MKITQDVREYAAQKQVDESNALAVGLNEKAEEFRSTGGEIYRASGRKDEIETGPIGNA